MQDSSRFSTKESRTMAMLMGYERYGAVGFTSSEMNALASLYSVDLKREGENPLERAGAVRNMFRATEQDGLRCMALLAKYCEAGQDPVRVMAEGLAEMGYDVHLEELDDDEE